MKRFALPLSLLVLLTAILLATAAPTCLAVYPVRDGAMCFDLQQGWFDDTQAWYICLETSNFRYAQTQGLTFTPKLDSAFGVAPVMYVVTNPRATQGPVFTSRPGDDDYSGLWTMVFIAWAEGATKVPLTSADQIDALVTAGDLIVCEPDDELDQPDDQPYCIDDRIAVDCPLLALGQLGGPWNPFNNNGNYRIRQALDYDPYKKTITLPTWKIFCSDKISLKGLTRKIIIPDVSDPELAEQLGANYAPGLLAIPEEDTQRLFVLLGYQPPGQLPIAEFCPEGLFERQSNFDYSPVQQLWLLNRNIPVSTVVDNPEYVLFLLGSGGLVLEQNDQVLNAPILPPKADIKVCKRSICIYLCDWLLPDNDRVDVYLNGRCLLSNHKLPFLLFGTKLDLFLKPGDNEFRIVARNTGLIKPCNPGIVVSDVCREFCNLDGRYYCELYVLNKGECATVIIRAP